MKRKVGLQYVLLGVIGLAFCAAGEVGRSIDLLEKHCVVNDSATVFALDGVVSAGDYVIADWEGPIAPPYARFRFLFVDDMPGGGWSHPCRYVFISEDGLQSTVLDKWSPPKIVFAATGEPVILCAIAGGEEADAKKFEAVKAAVYGYARGLGRKALPLSFTQGDADKSYFVIISGGASPQQNSIRFWSDAAMFYSTLTKKYGIAKDHIYVFMSDGLNSGADANVGTESSPVLEDSPRDLDGDGANDVTDEAEYYKIQDCFTSLKTSLTANDQLFVFATSHGYVHDGEPGVDNRNARLWLYTDPSLGYTDYIDDNELATFVEGFACPIAFILQSCYSGGFVDDLTAQPNHAVATACAHNETSYGGAGAGCWTRPRTAAFNFWAMPFISAFHGCWLESCYSIAYPWAESSNTVDADTTGDKLVSFYEAAQFAIANNSSSHGQYAESTSGLGSKMFLRKVTPAARPATDSFGPTRTGAGNSSASGTANLSNVGATAENGEPFRSYMPSATTTIWFKWSAPSTGDATFTTAGTGFDTVMGVYTGTSVGALTAIYQNDDVSGSDRTSKCTFRAERGKTYFICVGGKNGATGAIKLNWTLTVATPPAGPLYDDFGAARTSGGNTASSGSVTGTNVGATPQNGEPMRNYVASATTTVWLKWSARATADMTFTTAGTGFDTVMGVYMGSSVGGLTKISENDDAGGSVRTSSCTFRATQGATYFICVSGKNGATGTVRLGWSAAPPPNGPLYDDFGAARTSGGNTGVSGTVTGTNVGATPQNGEPLRNYVSSATTTVWLKWSAQTAGTTTFTTAGTGFDTVMGVYTGSSVGGLTRITENDDVSGSDRTSSCTFNATKGTPYFICVGGKNDATGTVKINWTRAAAPNGPLYDDFGAARTSGGNTASSGSVTGTNVGATPQNGEPLRADWNWSTATTTVWFKWAASSAGAVTFTTAGTGFDTVMGVYTGTSVGSLTEVMTSDDAGGSDRTSACSFYAAKGTSYFVCVGGKNGATGTIKLNWSRPSAPTGPLYDDFGAARTSAGSSAVSGLLFGTNVGATPQNGEPLLNKEPTATSTVWFKWIAPITCKMKFKADTELDLVAIGVYTGTSVGSLTKIKTNYNSSTFDVTSGTTYFICIGGYEGAMAPIQLSWAPDGLLSPFYDDFGTARVSGGNNNAHGTREGTNVNATPQNGEPLRNYKSSALTTVWFKWVAPSSCKMDFLTYGSDFDTVMGVYTGNSVGSLTPLVENDDVSGSDHTSSCTFDAVKGTTYFICIGGCNAATGNVKLSWLPH